MCHWKTLTAIPTALTLAVFSYFPFEFDYVVKTISLRIDGFIKTGFRFRNLLIHYTNVLGNVFERLRRQEKHNFINSYLNLKKIIVIGVS